MKNPVLTIFLVCLMLAVAMPGVLVHIVGWLLVGWFCLTVFGWFLKGMDFDNIRRWFG